MTEKNQAVITRLSAEFNSLSNQFARVSGDLTELHTVLTELKKQPVPQPKPAPQASPLPQPQPEPMPQPLPPQAPPPPWSQAPRTQMGQRPYPSWMQPAVHGPAVGPSPRPVGPYTPGAAPLLPPRPSFWQQMTADAGGGLIGKILAVAGVGVTLIGVVMMLVLAAEAGILRPEIRVGAGALLAAGLVVVAIRMANRPGGRVGAIALSATGVAAAYFDVVAVTRFYDWLPDYGGLVLAGAVTFGGLLLAHHWDSEHLGLLVLVPVFVLAPVLIEGPSLLLVGFMLAMTIGSFPVQIGKDWILLHTARVVVSTATLVAWIGISAWDADTHLAVAAVAFSVNVAFGVLTSAYLLRSTALPHLTAFLGCATAIPVVLAPILLDRWVAAVLIGAVAALLLAVTLVARGLPMVSRQIYGVASAAAAVIAVAVAFEGPVLAPLLLAMSLVIAVGGRRDRLSRIVAGVIGVLGGIGFLASSPPNQLAESTIIDTAQAASVVVGSLLVVAAIWTNLWAWYRAVDRAPEPESVQGVGIIAALISLYALTALTVTAGVTIGGTEGGFLGGHMAATICWMVVAATLLVISISIAKGHKRFGGIGRNVAVGAGLGLTAAAVAKLFLFDLATLDGIFRVAAFIVVGLILLAVGAGYARALGESTSS